MFWPFNVGKRRREALREAQQHEKIASSQLKLLHAATSTADAAQHVTSQLKLHLEESIRQYETTVAIMNDALLVCDRDGRVKAFNPAAECMFGYTHAEMEHGSVTELFRLSGEQPANCAALWEALEQEQDGPDPAAPLRAIRANGETFPIDSTMTRLDRCDGSTVMLMLVRELSVEVSLQQGADHHERRYRALFDLCFDGILIVQRGKVVAANPAAGILFDVEPSSLLSMPFSLLVNASDRSRVEMIDEIPVSFPISAEALRPDGRSLQLLLSSATITWNDEHACLITVKDTAGLKHIDDTLRVRHDREVDLIVCFTPDYHITFANAPYCAFHGLDPAMVPGTDVRSLLSGAERDALLLKLCSLTGTVPTRRAQVYAANPDGSLRLMDWIDHVSFASDGQVLEYQRTGRDITGLMDNLAASRTPAP